MGARKKSDRDIQEERSRPATWSVSHTATAGLAQATKAGVAGKRHILLGASGGYVGGADPGVVPGNLRVIEGGGSVIQVAVGINNGCPGHSWNFGNGLDVFGANVAIALQLSAGPATCVGYVTIWGITVDDEESL